MFGGKGGARSYFRCGRMVMVTHFPAIMFGALPQGILRLLPRLINPSARSSRAARGLAKTKAGERQVAKVSNERRVPNGDIF